MKDKNISFNRKLLTIVLPIAFQQLVLALVSTSDALMLGILSQDSLSAVSLAGQIQFIYNLFISGISTGTSIFVAQYWGIEDKKSIEKIIGIALKSSILISIIFFIGAEFFPKLLMKIFTSDTILIDMGAEYLQSVAISYILLAISQIYLCVMKNCGLALKSSIISFVSVAINIVLNAILIFGIGIFPALGVKGAAIATVISKFIELLWTMAIMLNKDNIKIKLKYILHNDTFLKKDFWKYTILTLGNSLVWGCGFAMYSVIMGHMNSDATAANSIANIIKNLVICFCTGVGNGGGILVGNELGKGNLDTAKSYASKVCKFALISGLVSGAIILLIIPFTPLFTGLTDTARSYLRIMLVVCSYYVVGKSLNMATISGIFCAGGDSKFGFICDTITMWAVTVPLGLLCAFVLKLSVPMVYIIINIDEIIKLPAVYKNYKKYRWLKNLTNIDELPTTDIS